MHSPHTQTAGPQALQQHLPAPASSGLAKWQRGSTQGLAPTPDQATDADFIALLQAFRSSGGLASGDELATRLHVQGKGGYSRLARWIVGRQAFSFSWHDHVWIPMFQFNQPEMSLHQGLRPVLGELAGVMDGWGLANWFARPNSALQGQSPASIWFKEWPEVFEAARLQRFVLKG